MALAHIQALEAANICEQLFAKIINSTGTGSSLESTKNLVAQQVIVSKKHAAVSAMSKNY
jgi:hypothetical protein